MHQVFLKKTIFKLIRKLLIRIAIRLSISLLEQEEEREKGNKQKYVIGRFFQSDSTGIFAETSNNESVHDDAPISKKVKQFPLYTCPPDILGTIKAGIYLGAWNLARTRVEFERKNVERRAFRARR